MKNIISPALSPVFYLLSGKDDCSILCSVCRLGYHCYCDGGPLQLKKMKNGNEPYIHLSLTGSDFYCCLGEEDKVCFQILSGG